MRSILAARRFRILFLGAPLLALALLDTPAGAQPFSQFLQVHGLSSSFVFVFNHSALNPTSQITLEAWVNVTDAGSCSSIIGKDVDVSYWVGICGTTLRSYLKGAGSAKDGGRLNPNEWSHIAVVYDGVKRYHYVNGEQVLSVAETGPLPASTNGLEIGSDVSWSHSPNGAIDDVYLWRTARTQNQIRQDLYGVSGTPVGLVSHWSLNNNANDSVGGHNGTLFGTANYGFFGTGPSCAPAASSSALCLLDRFLLTAKDRVGAQSTAEAVANVVPVSNPGSGLFWFFASDNWEVMVKALNGCALNSRYWIFSAATTNVFYRLEVFDYPTGTQKIYFNYPGPPAPAVTDVEAFATCP